MSSEGALRVAIQGERGAFSHQAALEVLGASAEVVPRGTFDELFAAVADGLADRALVPIENSLHGSIHENYDRLLHSPLHTVGETQLRMSPPIPWPWPSAAASSPTAPGSRR
jgi:prephenate dehydratase